MHPVQPGCGEGTLRALEATSLWRRCPCRLCGDPAGTSGPRGDPVGTSGPLGSETPGPHAARELSRAVPQPPCHLTGPARKRGPAWRWHVWHVGELLAPLTGTLAGEGHRAASSEPGLKPTKPR